MTLSIVDRDWVELIVNMTWLSQNSGVFHTKSFGEVFGCSVSMTEGGGDGFLLGNHIFE
jgi:hypothetical protein